MKKLRLLEIIAVPLVILFTYAALSKLFERDSFEFQLGRSPYITNYATLISWILPIVECAIAVLLILPKTRLVGFYASFFLMVLFTGYIYAMLHDSPFLPCSCGGVLSAMSWQQHFYFNIFFVLLSLAGILLSSRNTLSDCNKQVSIQ